MQINTPNRWTERTHEGAPAAVLGPEAQLRRSVLSCLLWEDNFYENGDLIAKRIADLVPQVPPEAAMAIAVEAREEQGLRHAPLWIMIALARTAQGVQFAPTLARIIQRPDELSEFLAMYWAEGRRPIDYQVKKGLAAAFQKFDEYQLAKYDRDNAVKLRDVMRMVHPRPRNAEQAALWKRVLDRTLETPDTWEVALSGGQDKREVFTRLLQEKKLGYLALLRNLRNMVEADVPRELIAEAIGARRGGADRVLPFRYVAAARACPSLEPYIDLALEAALAEQPKLPGETVILVDVSGSMSARLSPRSDMDRMTAAAALAVLVPAERRRVFTFSNGLVEVPPRPGMAGIDAIIRSQPHSGTWLGRAISHLDYVPYDRIIVVTDEQSADSVPPIASGKGYMINVASHRNGVGHGYYGWYGWTRLTGWSESVIRYIQAIEA